MEKDDPDKHMIEVGENMMMVQRFIDTGLLLEETATRMDVPVDYVKTLFWSNKLALDLLAPIHFIMDKGYL